MLDVVLLPCWSQLQFGSTVAQQECNLAKYINIIYCFARPKHNIWIAAMPELCSTAQLIKLNCLQILILKFDSDAMLLQGICLS